MVGFDLPCRLSAGISAAGRMLSILFGGEVCVFFSLKGVRTITFGIPERFWLCLEFISLVLQKPQGGSHSQNPRPCELVPVVGDQIVVPGNVHKAAAPFRPLVPEGNQSLSAKLLFGL